ncbi:MAG TPA: TPM domain-containing protein [Pyrinomonadaceae bacterium]|nr:TPM domain-containing protein [Pyrinomonadaceae bacterium]
MKCVAFVIALSLVTLSSASCNRFKSASTVASTSERETIKYVDDGANVLDEPARRQLETTLAALKERKKIDFSVVTVGSTGEKSVRDYSLALAHERKSSSSDKNVIAGLLLLVAVQDRNWHIQITRNLEDDLTEEILTNLSGPMTDSFRQKHYGEGVIKYVNAIIEKLEQSDG